MSTDPRTITFIESLAPRLLAYFARRVTPREDSSDLLSQALTIIWRKSESTPAELDEATGWAFAIAANVLANHTRSSTRRDRLVQKLREEISESADDFAAADARLDVAAAIAELSLDDAELIRLVYWDGLSATEAGAAIGMPGSTARLRVAQARSTLASRLGAEVR